MTRTKKLRRQIQLKVSWVIKINIAYSDYGFSLLFTLMTPLQIRVKKANINILPSSKALWSNLSITC